MSDARVTDIDEIARAHAVLTELRAALKQKQAPPSEDGGAKGD